MKNLLARDLYQVYGREAFFVPYLHPKPYRVNHCLSFSFYLSSAPNCGEGGSMVSGWIWDVADDKAPMHSALPPEAGAQHSAGAEPRPLGA